MSAIAPILKAIRIALDAPTDENIQALADVAGLTIKKEVPNKIEVVEHTTKKGKAIRGVVRTDLSYAEAKAIDEYTFKKDGGWFIREKHLSNVEPVVAGNDAPVDDYPIEPPFDASESEWESYQKAMGKFSALDTKEMQIVGTPKTIGERQLESRNAEFADYQKRIDALPISVKRALAYNIFKEITIKKGGYIDGTYPVNLKPDDISNMVSFYAEKAKKEPRNKGLASVNYSLSKDYALDKKAITRLAQNGLYADAYLDKSLFANNTVIESVQTDSLVNDDENNIEGLTRKFKPAAKKYKNPEIKLDTKEGVKLLKKTLTKLFPDTKFSVTMARGTAYGSAYVSWVDGASYNLVGTIAQHFRGSGFDGMTDSSHSLYALNEDGKVVDYGLGFISFSRSYSREFLEKLQSSFPDMLQNMIKQEGVTIKGDGFNAYFDAKERWTQDKINEAKISHSTGKYHYGAIPQAANDDFSLTSQSESERLAEDAKIKLLEQQKREAEEKARLKAQADKELNDFRLTGSSLPSDVAASYGQGDMFVNTRSQKLGENNVSSTSNAMESDSDNTIGTNQKQSAENGNANESGELGRLARPPVNGLDARGGSERDSGLSLPKNDGIGIGARGDTSVSDGAGERGVGASNTTTKSSRSSRTNESRTPINRERDSAIVRTSTRVGSVTQTAKEAEQLKAEGTPTQWGDAQNIDKALPYLLPEQRGDVALAEKRLIDDNKNGMLFTNGTGTGKTFTGLGAVKRFANAGKKNILIVSMNDKIIRDFIKSAKSLNLDVHQLDGITDNGKDKIVATTYANMAQNLTLGLRDWDLIVVDEAHNLMQGEKGEDTNALAKLRALSGHHAGFHEWVKMRHADKDPKPVGESLETGLPIYNQDEVAAWEAFKKPLREQWQKTWAEQPKGRTKVIFLTATPFSYVKTLDWAEGYLFDFVPPADKFSNKTDAMGSAYNSGGAQERFYMNNFGYKMRNNRLTRPDARVDVGILERKFAEKLKTEGAISGRELSVPFDYDRKFVLVNSKIGEKIDEGFKYLWDTKGKDGRSKYSDLLRVINKRFDYLARLQLLEAIKAQEAIDQIKKHLALGRKVIVFHDFNEGGTTNPFVVKGGLGADDATSVESQYDDFKRERPDLINLKLDIPAPLVTLRKVFPNALMFNGTVSKGQRNKNSDLFNSDDSGNNVMIAQSDAAATGISFHDTTGKHQRVIINIGMPTKPAKLRQTEGRIYRVGQASNAIQRYLTTGTGWERSAFAQKIAERAETVDNLAQGESAVVSIKDALVRAYEEAEYFEPSLMDGIGGKAYDEENARINKLTPFERAKSDYWVKQKVTAKRSEREGKEWYATPEPVGLFMVNLAGAHSGDDILEPSAGDGAIGRYMPSDASVTFIEPSDSLASRARMNNTNANVIIDDFENHNSSNKYDAIVMNPPFGQGGSIAIKHLVKAFEHLREGGRVVALLPVGKMDELIVKYHEMGYFKDIYTVAEFALPSSTFKNAGTGVNTKIHVFERHNFKDDAPKGVISKNLSHYDNIEDLFDAIENINIKPRKPRIDEALAEYGLEIYPDRSKYIITGEGLKRKDITSALFGSFVEKNKDGDVVEKYNRSIAYLKWLKDSQIPTMTQFNNGLSFNNLPIKYQQNTNKYNTWDGVGGMPDWLSTAINRYGGKLESFAVEKPVYDAVDDLEAERQKAKLIIDSIPKTLEKLKLLDETPQVLEVIKIYEKNLNDLLNAQTKEDYQKAFDVRQIATKESNALIGGKSAAFFEELRAKKALKSEVVEPKKTTNETLVALIGIALNEPSVSNLQKMATAAGLGLIVKKEKKLSKEQIDKYLEIAFSDDIVRADNWLMKELKAIGFDDDSRFNALHKAHNYFAQEKKNRELQAKKDAAKARKIANADNAKIKTIVDALLQKGRLLRGREYEFLVSIQNKRVLSVKQRDWLESIADRLGVPIKGNVVIKASQRNSNPDISFQDWAEEYLDQDIHLMSDKQKEEAYASYETYFDDASDDYAVVDTKAIITLLGQALTTPTDDNIQALADVAGLKIKPVMTDGFVKKGASRYEYIIWGVPKDESLEELLFTQNKKGEVIATIKKAQDIKALLEEKYGVTKARIQTVDLGGGFDFSKEILTSSDNDLLSVADIQKDFSLSTYTEAELRAQEAVLKAAEAKRQADEKAAKDKAIADKQVGDFRLSGSSMPSDVAASYGQGDMFVQTRGQQVEKPVTVNPMTADQRNYLFKQAAILDGLSNKNVAIAMRGRSTSRAQATTKSANMWRNAARMDSLKETVRREMRKWQQEGHTLDNIPTAFESLYLYNDQGNYDPIKVVEPASVQPVKSQDSVVKKPVQPLPSNETIHLQGIGKHPAIMAGDVKIGDSIVFNFGSTAVVKSITSKDKMVDFTFENGDKMRFKKDRLVGYIAKVESAKYDDIGGFNFTPVIDLDQTLKALKVAFADGSHDNIKRLATLAGLTLKEPEPDVDMFGEPINQDFDLFGEPIQDGDESPVEELPRLAVVELPLNKLTLSEDVPQFKSGVEDSETGVVEALGGKFDRTGVAPIQVWERLDGRLEIISGRHRTDLARRSGEKTIPAQVHKESEGFTAKQAMMLDAELNIRDGQGKVKDYVDYFTHSEISEDEAERRGLIARSIGQRAFVIASKGSEELITLHRNEIISDQAAAEISSIAPDNSAMQAVGLRVLQDNKPLNNALNTIRAVQALTREKGQEPDTFDLFGFDDSALKEAEAMARIASRKQRQIAEQLNAIKGAVKNPKLAAKHGVVVENEADALAKVKTMSAQKARWDNWSSHADLLAEVRKELNDKLDSLDYEDDDYYWLCQEELAA